MGPPPPFYGRGPPPGAPFGRPPPEWTEHSVKDGPQRGRKYYYNNRTKQTVWEKPVELMTTNERADATVSLVAGSRGRCRRHAALPG